MIVDEEQRFGVAHKERLKQLRKEVDVLTLTATPIPRTLHMSLAGVRDMSVMETAPEERLPIRTYVAEYDDGLVREAILRELDRGGQVYYVHNRVQSIEIVHRRLRELVPEARFLVGHGQMAEEQLERVMLDFAEGKADVLICTTIIESGLDIANANTIVIDKAHRLGLAQLYQLRGRVGRGPVRAYAYFLYARDTQLNEQAEARLRTIYEATELGAGFRIAMKDLEIRGAGNLLGAEQSGQIAAVGFDLYTRLLGEAVDLMRAAEAGTPPPMTDATGPDRRPSLDLPLDAFLPSDYVADEAARLNLYQRFATAGSGEQVGALIAELEDRFGPLPEQAQNLVYQVGLRLEAQRAGVSQITATDHEIVVKLHGRPPADVAGLSREVGAALAGRLEPAPAAARARRGLAGHPPAPDRPPARRVTNRAEHFRSHVHARYTRLTARSGRIADPDGGESVAFLRTISDDEATGEVAEIYRRQREASGYVPESTRVLTTRPDVLVAYTRFVEAIRGGFSLPQRDWKLITLVAAKHIPSTYCSLAYGKNLLGDLDTPEAVLAVQRDFRRAGLSERDVAMLEYAEQVTNDASKVTQRDIDRLREHGFSDEQIADIAVCAAFRNFISRYFDAVGATPDDEYRALDPSFRDALIVGRPFR